MPARGHRPRNEAEFKIKGNIWKANCECSTLIINFNNQQYQSANNAHVLLLPINKHCPSKWMHLSQYTTIIYFQAYDYKRQKNILFTSAFFLFNFLDRALGFGIEISWFLYKCKKKHQHLLMFVFSHIVFS